MGTTATATRSSSKAAQQKRPFRKGTRIRRNPIPFTGSTAFTISSTSAPAPFSVNLPNVGMVSRIIVHITGTYASNSTTPVLADKGPWNLLKQIQFSANLGYAQIYNTSGFSNFAVVGKWLNYGYLGNKAGVGDTTPNVDFYSFPLAASATAQAFTLSYAIPINLNYGMNFEMGLINMQSPEIQGYLQLNFGSLTDVDSASAITSITGSIDLQYEFMDIGPTRMFSLPPNVVVRILEDNQPIGQTGDNNYQVPRMGTVLQIAQIVTLNGARSDQVDGSYYRFNQGTVPEQWDRITQVWFERWLYGTNHTTGVFFFDWFCGFYGVSNGDLRDAVNSERIATWNQYMTVSSGATLGSNNNTLTTVRRLVQPLVTVQPQQVNAA
ncbi:MAG TPA: hypothetical protein VK807_23300 [Gemmatimonadaceae bacterium]|jgi:hypothetical protein|nr:hypothetical protein [Gemmatimonadaceae bacterium]